MRGGAEPRKLGPALLGDATAVGAYAASASSNCEL